MTTFYTAYFTLLLVATSQAFTLMPTTTIQTTSLSAHRRQFLQQSLVAAITVSGAPSLANADVSDGNALPQGAAQFGRVIRAKTDLEGIQKRVSTGAAEMDKNEWDNVGQFLRKLYSVSEDMKAIAANFYDPDKKKRASELINELKKYSKAADASTGSQNGPEFLAYARKLSSIVDEFLDLLRDVPDEI